MTRLSESIESLATGDKNKISFHIQDVVSTIWNSKDTIEGVEDDNFRSPRNKPELQSIELGGDREERQSQVEEEWNDASMSFLGPAGEHSVAQSYACMLVYHCKALQKFMGCSDPPSQVCQPFTWLIRITLLETERKLQAAPRQFRTCFCETVYRKVVGAPSSTIKQDQLFCANPSGTEQRREVKELKVPN